MCDGQHEQTYDPIAGPSPLRVKVTHQRPVAPAFGRQLGDTSNPCRLLKIREKGPLGYCWLMLLCSAWAPKFVLYGGGEFINPVNPSKWRYYHYQSILITLFRAHYSYHAVPERSIPIKVCLSSYSYHAVPTKIFKKIVKFIIFKSYYLQYEGLPGSEKRLKKLSFHYGNLTKLTNRVGFFYRVDRLKPTNKSSIRSSGFQPSRGPLGVLLGPSWDGTEFNI